MSGWSPLPERGRGQRALSLGLKLARPWFDRVALGAIASGYFPLSRAWAAAGEAEGSLARFLAEVPLVRLPRGAEHGVVRALRRLGRRQAALAAAERAWEAAYYGAADVSEDTLLAAETARRSASHRFMMARFAFVGLRLRARLPGLRPAFPTPDEVEERHGQRLRRPESAYLVDGAMPEMAQSRRLRRPGGAEYWLRFPSPMGDLAWAHVFEPVGAAYPPSVVWGHGLGVEVESLDGVDDGALALQHLGVRLVRLEAPWHNRRRLAGRYGGEPFLATQPMGTLDHLAAAVGEFAAAIHWCRRAGSARVAVGGASLGALTSQVVASQARAWPEAARPDALCLVTTTGDVPSLGFESSLARAMGIAPTLAAAGWTPENLARWRPLVDPAETAPLPSERIVMALGRRDDVTPFAGGLALARRWRVPRENLFLRPGGHFSVALELMGDPAPLACLAEMLRRG